MDPEWIHEIKHDGFRIIARKEGGRVRLITRNGYDFRNRFPLPSAAISALSVRSCVIDGEAENGLVTLCAFDLLELDGEDLRDQPIEDRKAALKTLLPRSDPGISYNRHFDVEGSVVFHRACKARLRGHRVEAA